MKLTVHHGEITALAVDAIVNAANCRLEAGGGVCGAIHRAAGPELADECQVIGQCPQGGAVVTHGYRLLAPWIIHAVGPVWIDGNHNEAPILHAAYFSALKAASDKGCRSIAFPCISTGIYGYPPDLARGVALMAVADFVRTNPDARVQEVVFCCFSAEDAQRYENDLRLSL